jgi:hypothetical protein
VLKVGQAVSISGTDVVCAFGGPTNQIGLACLHTRSKSGYVYSFRIDEEALRVFRATTSGAVQVGVWKEPAAGIQQPHSSAVSKFNSIGRVSSGSYLDAAGTDIRCKIYFFKGAIQVACFKVDTKGIMDGSYAVALGGLTVQVSRFQAGRGTTVFVGRRISSASAPNG